MRRQFKSWIFLVLYCLILFSILVFKQVPVIRAGGMMFDFGGTQAGEPNLVPFKTIWPYLTGEFGLLIGGLNILGNIIFLIPLGLLLPQLFSRINQLRVLLIAVLFCLAIELTQVYFKIGIFDIDDVLLNVLGVMVGYWMVVYLPVVWGKMKADRKWMAGVIIMSSLGTLLSVYSIVESLTPPAMGMGGSINKPQQLDPAGALQTGDKDLCDGSGGTGVLLTVDSSVITIRRKDDVVQEIKLNAKTVIKASSGEIRVGDLKPGNRVTLVIDESETAALVLVCGG